MKTSRTSTANLVVAKLNGRAQDPLHAAVVLEAWGGRSQEQSIREVDVLTSADMSIQGPQIRPAPTESLVDIKEFAVLVTVLASVFLWLPALRDLLGAELTSTMAWALPGALALDRVVRVRYLSSGQIRSIDPALWPLNAISVLALVAASMVGTATYIGAALVIIWGQAGIFAIRKWSLVYINIVVGSASWIYNDGSVTLVFTVAVAGVLIASTAAVLSTAGDKRLPESLWVTAAAAVSGASAGVLLTADSTMWDDNRWWIGLAVVTVAVSGWWGSIRLSRLWVDLPTQLADIDVNDPEAGWGGVVVSDAVVGALARIALPTYALLILCVALGQSAAAGLVAAFSMFASAMLLLGLAVATKQWAAATAISVAGAFVSIVVPPVIPALPLLAGAGLSAVGFGVLAIFSFRDSATTFATRMLIR